MADPDLLVWFLVAVMAIEGVWLAGLTYLLWRRHRATTAARAPEPAKET